MPPFDDNGNLPGEIYDLCWSEFEERFGNNGHRQRLIVGLRRGLILLAQAGCQYVCVGGSFVTRKSIQMTLMSGLKISRLVLVLSILFLTTGMP